MPNWPYRATERVFTYQFGWVLALVTVVPVGMLALLLAIDVVTVGGSNQFIDSVVKILVAGVGAMWALNRYFIGRVDAAQIRVEAQAQLIRQADVDGQPAVKAILPYRVELTNAGNTRFDDYTIRVDVERVTLRPASELGEDARPIGPEDAAGPSGRITREADVHEIQLERLGGLDSHAGGAIEPRSWAAVSDALVVDAATRIVRIFVAVDAAGKPGWTWHHMFELGESGARQARATGAV